MSISMIEDAYLIVSKSKKEIAFADLLRQVGEDLGITDQEELIKKAGSFYTDLSLDGRFVILPNNFWDLKTRHVSNIMQIEVSEVNTEDSDDEKVSELGEETDEDKKGEYTSDDDDDDDDSANKNPNANPDIEA